MDNNYMPYVSAAFGALIFCLELVFSDFLISIFGNLFVLPVIAGLFLLILLFVFREGNEVFPICFSIILYFILTCFGASYVKSEMAIVESIDNYNQKIKNTYNQISNNESPIDITDCDTKEIYKIAIEKGYSIQHKDERVVLTKEK